LADRFIVGVAPIDYGPVILRMPFGFHLALEKGLLRVPLRERAEDGSLVEWIEINLQEA
jgi:hypothetical protein